MAVEYRLLGPVEVLWEGRPLRMGGPKPRALLAALLLRAGHVVPADALVDVVWGEEPPETARALVQSYVSALRRALPEARRGEIETRAPGYAIRPEAGAVDLQRFEEAAATGRRAAARGDHADAARWLRDALALWRGPALGGVGEVLAGEAARLEEARQAVREERVAAELEAGGRENELIVELKRLVGRHPTRERLRGQLMLALYRVGRQADALALFEEGRAVLAEELGIDPCPELDRLHGAILRADPGLLRADGGTAAADLAAPQPPGPAWPVCLLPPAIGDFTGRKAEIAEVVEGLTAPRDATPVVVVSGPAGVGKSALAVKAAHLAMDAFPDGQLYGELQGTGAPLPPGDVLGRLLRALGAAPPDDPAERADLFRGLVAGRRLLLVLDDAGSEAQVRPLLPGSAGCGVLVTSRARLGGLDGVRRTDLAVLDEGRSLELLARVTGPRGATADPDEDAAARRIVTLCGGLPLALRIAGARLTTRRHWTPRVLAERLEDERRRLDELAVGDLEVRASLGLSYASLDHDARTVLRRLAALGPCDMAPWTVALLVDGAEDAAEEVLERLVDAQLLDWTGTDSAGQSRYRAHDLVRVYAAERAEAEDTAEEHTAAVGRALAAGLRLVERVAEEAPSGIVVLRPYLGGATSVNRSAGGAAAPWNGTGARGSGPAADVGAATTRRALADPYAWFEAEADTLATAVERAAALGLHALACAAATVLCSSSFAVGNRFDAWWRSHDAALAAARRAEDRAGEALLLIGLGQLRFEQDRYAEAQEYFRQAEPLCAAVGDLRGRAAALTGLGGNLRELGRLDGADDALKGAVEVFRRLGDEAGVGLACRLRGSVRLELGDHEGATALLHASLRAYRSLGSRRGEALTLRTLSLVHRSLGAYEEAERQAGRAHEILAGLGDPLMAAYAERARAKARLRLGRNREAEAELLGALDVCRAYRDRFGEALTLRTLGECALADGRHHEAEKRLTTAVRLWEALELRLPRARTLRDLATVREALGDGRGAASLRTEAESVFTECGVDAR
ncbi:AfsR/SARP family transcriptional regulator [Streptomyces spectabilis]|uniref:AfsR family transcriptional regulator n=1 Tax=Streptomyces spectabilis TaxID=68270 RepID=A0A5P2X1E4_STRST|nr:AfsR/SARP family transcriptional regulator [Streptomyces spectabilis]MBB5101468.1 DNA-binding SARP family transcriptional activator [Streptomyces spectabilis]MCI3900660.1 tetratricopeptide repeat protein [Streptomyces spectabilis]QEV58208.1 AfsR family transcriptional regulator [Streptomyces spectabilis]GGV11618.1 SARP family transcriptional regulator [Streptomyces spectabilis]